MKRPKPHPGDHQSGAMSHWEDTASSQCMSSAAVAFLDMKSWQRRVAWNDVLKCEGNDMVGLQS